MARTGTVLRRGVPWWLRVVPGAMVLLGAVSATALALGRNVPDSLGLAILVVLVPSTSGTVSARRRRRDAERRVLAAVHPPRRAAVLDASYGREVPDDPAVAAVALRLLLTLDGDARAARGPAAAVALLLAALAGLAAVVASSWWWGDVVALGLLAATLLTTDRRLRGRRQTLLTVAASRGRSLPER